MSDEHNLRFKKILHSLATRVPKIILQRVEEVYPALKESLVSVVYFVNQKIFCDGFVFNLCFPSSRFVKNGLYMLQGKSVNILCISFNVTMCSVVRLECFPILSGTYSCN
jgi:hypothetical protein